MALFVLRSHGVITNVLVAACEVLLEKHLESFWDKKFTIPVTFYS